MCGIYGVINRKVRREQAMECLDTMIHRGPDKRRCTRNVQVRSDGRTLKKIQCPFLYHGNFFLPHILRRNWREA